MLQYETPLPWCHGNFNGLAVFDLLSVHDLLRLRVVLTFYRLSIVSVKEGSSRRFVALLHGPEQMADLPVPVAESLQSAQALSS